MVNRPRVVPLAASQLSLEHASASCLELEILSHKSDNEIIQETGTTITTNCISLSKALQHISSKKLHVYCKDSRVLRLPRPGEWFRWPRRACVTLFCGFIRLMDKILHDPKDPKLWELWYIPYYGSCRILSINRTVGCSCLYIVLFKGR